MAIDRRRCRIPSWSKRRRRSSDNRGFFGTTTTTTTTTTGHRHWRIALLSLSTLLVRRGMGIHATISTTSADVVLPRPGGGVDANVDDDLVARHRSRAHHRHRDADRNGNDDEDDDDRTTTTHSSSSSTTNANMPELRIINGSPVSKRRTRRANAQETRYTYPASLQYNSQHFCGGALVAPDIVITAAHCTSIATITDIALGRYDLDSASDVDYEIMGLRYDGVMVHPNYDKVNVRNDVAILLLDGTSDQAYVVINRDDNVPYEGEYLTVMGWGDIDPDSVAQVTSDVLRMTDLMYISNDVCAQSEGYATTSEGYQFMTFEGTIDDTMLCAYGDTGGSIVSDACQGDSGGPLIQSGSDSSSDVLVGLVSWGFSCADSDFPGVYSRLSALYEDFLRPTICEYSAFPPEYMECDGGDLEGLAVFPLTQSPVSFNVPTTPSPASTPFPVSTDSTPSPASSDSTFNISREPTDLQALPDEQAIHSIPTPPPVPISSPNYNPLSFTPVTGSITCATAGMACTIKCTNCASLKRVALGMDVESPDEYTIIYTTERGTDEYPDDPSRLIVVGTDSTDKDEISCDGGCTCRSVNDRVLGCGLVAQSISGPYPSSSTPDALNCSVCIVVSRCFLPCILVLLSSLRLLSV
ncbi:hypothetical protein ACHAXA_000619 [Cyclostephanos tholiformis]|uniref:Peptidase S1 domain-containing protein n=1 Tax=Cyclostephanos tholiformis TaxID=382380 RepID=A0ABD3SQQ1_9STRA